MTTQAPSSKRTIVVVSVLLPVLVAITLAWYIAFVHAATEFAQIRNLALLNVLNVLMVFIDNRIPSSTGRDDASADPATTSRARASASASETASATADQRFSLLDDGDEAEASDGDVMLHRPNLDDDDDDYDDEDDDAFMHSSSPRDAKRLALPLHDAKPRVSTELRSLLVQ